MQLELSSAPPGIAEYAAGLRNLTNAQLFERIAAWPDRDSTQFTDPVIIESFLWTLRCEIDELCRRLDQWLAAEPATLPPYSGVNPTCPKCRAGLAAEKKMLKAAIRTNYCPGPDPDAICWLRLEQGREHFHRMCKACGYEWVESCESAETDKPVDILTRAAEMGPPMEFPE